MSVLKSKRAESKFEVFHSFYQLRSEITKLVFYRLGYKGKETDENFGFYQWVIDGVSQSVMQKLSDIQREVTMANSIYPTSLMECDERRKFQDHAIGLMYALLQDFQFVLEVVPIDKQRYIRYSDMINKEIDLLKNWRQSDNHIRRKIESGNL